MILPTRHYELVHNERRTSLDSKSPTLRSSLTISLCNEMAQQPELNLTPELAEEAEGVANGSVPVPVPTIAPIMAASEASGVSAASDAAAASAVSAASDASGVAAASGTSAEASKTPDIVPSMGSSTEKVTPPAASESTASVADYKSAKSVYDFTVKDASGKDVSMQKYKGHVLLIVNIASKCGYTPSNNKELTELKEKYESKGLRILAFPCNQFMGQEPGTNEEIACFLAKKNADFGEVFSKCEVNGSNSIPLYKYLKNKLPGTMGNFIKWNYTKFIVDKNGIPVERHGPNVSPNSLIPNLERYL